MLRTSSTWRRTPTSRCSSEQRLSHITREDQRHLLLLTSDPLVVRGANKAADSAGLVVATARDRPDGPAAVIVIDLEQPGALDDVTSLRAAHPNAILVGHLSRPDRDRWVGAERAGCDLVATRGAVGRQLRSRLDSGDLGRRRFPLIDDDEVAGRLGFVARVDETPFGAVAIYQVGGRVTVIDDVCPHAGAQLSTGEVSGCVVTCPRHGSQFDVQTGDRLRGPADQEVRSHEVLRDSGRVQLVWLD